MKFSSIMRVLSAICALAAFVLILTTIASTGLLVTGGVIAFAVGSASYWAIFFALWSALFSLVSTVFWFFE